MCGLCQKDARRIHMKFDYIEIGSSCFKTLAEVFKDDDSIVGLSIEPMPPLHDIIESHCLGSKNKHFLNAAVVGNPEIKNVRFYYTMDKNISSISEAGIGSTDLESLKRAISKARFPVRGEIKEKTVKAFTFNALLKKYGITSVEFLKIDTEGSDYDIVKDLLISNINIEVVLFEVDPFMTKEQIEELTVKLQSAGYNTERVDRDMYCYKPETGKDYKYYTNISKKYYNKNKWLKKVKQLAGKNE